MERYSEFRMDALSLARLLRALANGNRLLVLNELARGELSVNVLAGRVGLSQSALSQHLAILRESRLVRGRRKSQTVFYEVDHATLAEVKGRLGDIIPVEADVQDEPNLQAHDANAALLSALS